MCCVGPPSPCRLFTTASFPCLSPAFSALPWQQKCWNKTFHHTHGSRRADGLHLNLEIRGNCSLLGAPFNVRVQKNVKRSHLMCETLSDSESERRPSLGAFWKLLWLFSRGRCERICLLFSRTTSSVKYFVVWFDLYWQQMDKLQNWSVPSVDV